ncbi:DUF6745 domain-containing protein [Arthrobacter sp. GN70]|uniref:DUF6745 domain-containing protein n=1 Tax=Arthrobacter sp. GN70 TaxID=2838876 RepID=UPI001BFD570B|nr:hypothetical protein [Arthrobacter sp. GN70]MBT8161022.1 hypothetical protein [Arthrobacter sp. GN70]
MSYNGPYKGKLTPEDLAMLQETITERMAQALSTERCDRATAEAAVRELYTANNLAAPAFIWMDSPLGGIFALSTLKTMAKGLKGDHLRDQLRGQLGDQLWGQLGDQLGDHLRGQLWDQLWDQLRGQLRGHLWDQLGDQLGDHLGDHLRGQLRGQLWDHLRDHLRDQLRDQLGDQLGDQLRGQLRDHLRDQLWDQLWDQLRGQLRGQLRDQLGDHLRDQLRGQLGDQLWGQLGDQLWDQLRGQLWDQLWDQLGDQLRGQLGDQLKDDYNAYYNGFTSWYETYWTVLYSKAFEIAKIHAPELEHKLSLFTRVMDNTGWWYATPAVAFMTERPVRVLRDAQGRLHGPKRAAIEYADGYTLNAWHGTRLPVGFHETDWTLEAVMKETNAEVRRCAIEATGWEKFVAKSGMKPVGKPVPDPGNAPFELALYDLPKALNGLYAQKARVLLCTNGTVERDGTRHKYGLIVEGHQTDPVAAAASLYGVDRDTYATLEIRK